MKKTFYIESEVAEDYRNGYGLEYICKKHHIGKLRAKEIIKQYGIELRKPSSYTKKRNFVVSDWRIEKYPKNEGYHYIAKSKDYDYTTNDYMNGGGFLTTFIKEKYGIETPTLYDRRIYYQETGNYWWEQWFDIIEVKDVETKKCPYCDWETKDIENKSGAFEVHLNKVHNISVSDYLKDFPKDVDYFQKRKRTIERENFLKDDKNYVVCPICNERFNKLTHTHIKTHGISVEEFHEKYPNTDTLSQSSREQVLKAVKMGNLHVSKNRFISKYERELQEYVKQHGIEFETNRQILIGKEIDILIPSLKIGIEFNGLKYHTEWFGNKKHKYHLDKTERCNEKGYGLIHIFEDEYVNHKDIVYHKLGRILHFDNDLPKIMARKSEVKEIYKYVAEEFLNKYHIQGFSSSSVYLGCFYEGELYGVMSFKNGNIKNDDWELTRFATNHNYRCIGFGGKLFSYFVKNYKPERVISFADRRWTVNPYDNLYTKLNFKLDRFNPPDYKYYLDESKNGQKYERIHKLKLNKQKLHKQYGFPITMTESEMAKELGYDRIWDCGLIRYVWTADEK